MLSVLTVLLLGVTGWLGGELSYRHRIGVMDGDRPPSDSPIEAVPEPKRGVAAKGRTG